MSTINITDADGGEILLIGPSQIRILEDGSRTDNRIGAVEVMVAARTPGPPQHRHQMHDETFLVTRGVVRFIVGDTIHDAHAHDYVVVPAGAWHTFTNASAETAVFFNSFTPAYYVHYFRELAAMDAGEGLTPDRVARLMARYATEQC